ncbi:peptidase inhibitor family I36 protein [Streptomyces sp. NPDC051776]|uniref:peptidase inhibitor family I36 protein n=1 Tax=Streptomyces sp. NPDC051776 TaxID=3155414 RepID=UPI0034229F93
MLIAVFAAALLPSAFVTAASAAPTASVASTAFAAPSAAAAPRLGGCEAGQLCLWQKDSFGSRRLTYELSQIDIESCVRLPRGIAAASLANRTGRPVTTYQSAECAETGEFETYPGGGTWVPQSPYQVRAFKVWES